MCDAQAELNDSVAARWGRPEQLGARISSGTMLLCEYDAINRLSVAQDRNVATAPTVPVGGMAAQLPKVRLVQRDSLGEGQGTAHNAQ